MNMEKMINKMLKKSEPILNAGKPKPMTEQEYIQTCNTEQLAEVLFNFAFMCSYCGDESHSSQEKMQQCHFGKCGCRRKDWEMWLKQPHTPKE